MRVSPNRPRYRSSDNDLSDVVERESHRECQSRGKDAQGPLEDRALARRRFPRHNPGGDGGVAADRSGRVHGEDRGVGRQARHVGEVQEA